MMFLSGQVAWDSQRRLIGRDDLKAQTLHALRNVENALGAAGATLANVVAMRLYIVDYASQQAPQITEALRTAFEGKSLPACTWIGVAALADEGFLIEIEVIAVAEEEGV